MSLAFYSNMEILRHSQEDSATIIHCKNVFVMPSMREILHFKTIEIFLKQRDGTSKSFPQTAARWSICGKVSSQLSKSLIVKNKVNYWLQDTFLCKYKEGILVYFQIEIYHRILTNLHGLLQLSYAAWQYHFNVIFLIAVTLLNCQL